MEKYYLEEHSADIRIHSISNDLEGLFINSAMALCEILLKEKVSENHTPAFRFLVDVNSIDIETLLVDFLSETLRYMHTNKAIIYHIEIIKLNNNSIKAEAEAFKVNEFQEDIKAVTYHQAEVKLNDDGKYHSYIVLDV